MDRQGASRTTSAMPNGPAGRTRQSQRQLGRGGPVLHSPPGPARQVSMPATAAAPDDLPANGAGNAKQQAGVSIPAEGGKAGDGTAAGGILRSPRAPRTPAASMSTPPPKDTPAFSPLTAVGANSPSYVTVAKGVSARRPVAASAASARPAASAAAKGARSNPEATVAGTAIALFEGEEAVGKVQGAKEQSGGISIIDEVQVQLIALKGEMGEAFDEMHGLSEQAQRQEAVLERQTAVLIANGESIRAVTATGERTAELLEEVRAQVCVAQEGWEQIAEARYELQNSTNVTSERFKKFTDDIQNLQQQLSDTSCQVAALATSQKQTDQKLELILSKLDHAFSSRTHEQAHQPQAAAKAKQQRRYDASDGLLKQSTKMNNLEVMLRQAEQASAAAKRTRKPERIAAPDACRALFVDDSDSDVASVSSSSLVTSRRGGNSSSGESCRSIAHSKHSKHGGGSKRSATGSNTTASISVASSRRSSERGSMGGDTGGRASGESARIVVYPAVPIALTNLTAVYSASDHQWAPRMLSDTKQIVHSESVKARLTALQRMRDEERKAVPELPKGMWGAVNWHSTVPTLISQSLRKAAGNKPDQLPPRLQLFETQAHSMVTDCDEMYRRGATDDEVWTALASSMYRAFEDKEPEDFSHELAALRFREGTSHREAVLLIQQAVETAEQAHSDTLSADAKASQQRQHKMSIARIWKQQFNISYLQALVDMVKDSSKTPRDMISLMVRHIDFNEAAKRAEEGIAIASLKGSGYRRSKLDGHAATSGSGDAAGEGGRQKRSKGPSMSVTHIAELHHDADIAVMKDQTQQKTCHNCLKPGHFWADCNADYDAGNWADFQKNSSHLSASRRIPTNQEQYRQAQQHIQKLRANSSGSGNKPRRR